MSTDLILEWNGNRSVYWKVKSLEYDEKQRYFIINGIKREDISLVYSFVKPVAVSSITIKSVGETRSIKATCRPDDFTSLAMSPIDDEYKGYIEIKKIRYSNGKIWYSSKPKEYKLEWM